MVYYFRPGKNGFADYSVANQMNTTHYGAHAHYIGLHDYIRVGFFESCDDEFVSITSKQLETY